MTGTLKTKRLSAKSKADSALEVLSGAPRREVAEKHGVTETELNSWVEMFLSGGRDAFRNRRDDAFREAEVARLHQKIGELVMRLESTSSASPNGHGDGEEES